MMSSNSALDHLPATQRRELERVTAIIFEEFDLVRGARKSEWSGRARILKILLYGSHARGDWVDDPSGGYRSDYDILVVVNDARVADQIDFWATAEDRLTRDVTVSRTLSTPVNLIIHDIDDINRQLERGRPFFVDLVQEAVALFEADGFTLSRPRKLPPDEARVEAKSYFDEWYPSALTFFRNALDNVQRQRPKEAAFLLHQTVERLYHCVLLVLTLHSPKSHKLGFLRSQCEQLDQRLVGVWPRSSRFEQRSFELLRHAYVNARYSPHYRVDRAELAWLAERIEALIALVAEICRERLE